MCGIFAILGQLQEDEKSLRADAIERGKRIRHRGPDWSGNITIQGKNSFSHERLAIVGLESGAQPFSLGPLILLVNGEIYNHLSLAANKLKKEREFMTQSDCEIILYLYEDYGSEFVDLLDGIFSFVLYDEAKDMVLVARDPIGVTTLYYGFEESKQRMYFASEMKCFTDVADHVRVFEPGCFIYQSVKSMASGIESIRPQRFYNPTWWNNKEPISLTTSEQSDLPDTFKHYERIIRESLVDSVRKRLMAEVPFGVLLSGGLDSSLIAAIVAKELTTFKKINQSPVTDGDVDHHSMNWWPRLHTFSIGLANSPDLKAARKVADYIKSIHHEFVFTVQEGLDALEDVIYHLETYDVTTIRASTPMFLLSRRIKSLGVKMVLSGEGADELFGGYLYFHSAPSEGEFQNETIDRVKNLHYADNLRANKSTMAWGLEARVPFLDKSFVNLVLSSLPTTFKREFKGNKMEKSVLRSAFDTGEYLPESVLWRQKEQFSDGVGYNWINELKEWTSKQVSEKEMSDAAIRYPINTPATPEALYYRRKYEELFPPSLENKSISHQSTVKLWVPRVDWGCSYDPSGRAQGIHESAYERVEE